MSLLSDVSIFLAAEQTALEGAEGGFARRLAVLCLEEPDSQGNRAFLTKVLAAAQLNLNQDALLTEIPGKEPRSIAADLRRHQPLQVLVFGLTPAQLGLSVEIPLYQPFSFYGVTWLFADKLSALEPDKTKKSQLWTALQKIFFAN